MCNELWRLITVEFDEWIEKAILEYLLEIYPESMMSDMLGTGWKKEDEDNIKRDIENAVRWVRNGHKIDKWIKLHKSLHNRSMGKETTSERLSSTFATVGDAVEFVDNDGSVLFTLNDVQSVDIQKLLVLSIMTWSKQGGI